MKILVKCTLLVPVEIPDNDDYDMYFDIEENHCPGTGLVGAAIDAEIKKCGDKFCWACNFQGKNEIVKNPIHGIGGLSEQQQKRNK